MKPAEAPSTLRASPSFAPGGLAPAGGLTVVAPVSARGVAGDRRYTYVDRASPGEVRQAKSLFWDDPPPRVLERALVDGLRANLGPAVGPDVAAVGDRRLAVRLERFEEATGGGAPAEAVVAFEVTALSGLDRKLVLANRYCAHAPIAGEAPTDRARAFEAATADAVLQLAADLRANAARAPAC